MKGLLFSIVTKRARSLAHKESRYVAPGVRAASSEPATPDVSELLARAKEAIAKLPAAERNVLLLSEFEGLKSVEICARLRLQPGTSRVLLHRARAHLRRTLADLTPR